MIRPRIELGIQDERAQLGDHIAYFWETDQEFEAAVGFLETGRREGDFCVVFGHEEANDRVVALMTLHGFDCARLQQTNGLAILGGQSTGDAILASLEALFAAAIKRGAPVIRLLGNIGWGRAGWPEHHDMLAFEARVTDAARRFPAVVVCMYDVRSLPGPVVLHGAFETHPITFCANVIRRNPYYIGTDQFIRRP